MKFGELCTAFPADPQAWPTARLSRALPFHLRARLRALFGGLLASGDIARTRAPSKTGISIRPFEVGDPTSTIARSLLMRTGELYTRTDQAPGRQHASIVIHAYGNMAYQGDDAPGNKAQLAVAAAAILANAHDSLGHAVEVSVVTGDELASSLVRHRNRLPRRHHFYLISDFLFAPESLEATRQKLAAAFSEIHRSPGALIVVRDPTEWPVDNPLAREQSLLVPFGGVALAERRFSGATYIAHLTQQLDDLSQYCARHRIALLPVRYDAAVEPFTDAILRRLEEL